jgi:adenine-specific DNA-methyltransferase
MAYCKIILDEIFGRNNYLNTITMTTNDPSGFKATASTIFSTANYLLIYAKDKTLKPLKKVYIEKKYDIMYSKYLKDRNLHYEKWEWENIRDVTAKMLNFDSTKAAINSLKENFDDEVAKFAISHCEQVFQTAAISGGAALKRKSTIELSKQNPLKVFVHPNEDVEDFYILNGRQILFYKNRFINKNGEMIPAEIITDVWTDISWNGIAKEGDVVFKNGKKPELLIQRIFEMCTEKGDLVLDSFAGSGTTGAVAHKMGRRWIMIELGEHCHTHIIPRLKKVIDGEDKGGITESAAWKGGGGFRYYRLAPSLLEKDKYGNWIINKTYNPAMLAEAVCKLEGFTYAPSDTIYWMHGTSTENDYIYVTTQSLNNEQLALLSDEVGKSRTLLVMCTAFRVKAGGFFNLTIKKIPNTVLAKCEWGHDDYSLQVENLPMQEKPKKRQLDFFEEEE